MNEKPLERLNYFNGQRLQAADFKLEQDYHMRVRRWLNRSLYDAGIANGLSVFAIKGAPRVRVTPGLAIDHLGREIILLDEQIVDVGGDHHAKGGRCKGPYLSIRYQEDVIAQQDSSCGVSGSADRPAWGGPARILAEAALELTADLPNESSGRIPLACLTLGPGCATIDGVDSGVRRYIGRASANKVRQYALEGVRDFDGENPATIAFHIRGRQPTAVTLYLRSERFPTMFYSEMGHHTHAMNVSLQGGDGMHSHELGSYTTENGGNHGHALRSPFVSANEFFGANFFRDIALGLLAVAPPPGFTVDRTISHWSLVAVPITDYTFEAAGLTLGTERVPNETTAPGSFQVSPHAGHSHDYGSQANQKLYTAANDARSNHTHAFANNSNDPAGVTDTSPGKQYSARTGGPLTFPEGIEIEIDGTPVTISVLSQIKNNRPQGEDWSRLGSGDGGTADALANSGTGPIKIDYLVALGEGEHIIKLSLQKNKKNGSRNGGRIHFNLYVE